MRNISVNHFKFGPVVQEKTSFKDDPVFSLAKMFAHFW